MKEKQSDKIAFNCVRWQCFGQMEKRRFVILSDTGRPVVTLVVDRIANRKEKKYKFQREFLDSIFTDLGFFF